MSAADVNPFTFRCHVGNGEYGHCPSWDLVIHGLCISLFEQHEYQILQPAMAENVNITSRKKGGLSLDPEDGLGQLAWKERMSWNSGRARIALLSEQERRALLK